MKLLFISLGCDKNLVDSEEMLGMLAADGHQIVDDEDAASLEMPRKRVSIPFLRWQRRKRQEPARS